MNTIEKKTLKTSVTGIGNIEVTMLLIGTETWLHEIELFATKSSDKFQVIACQKKELQNPLFMQRIIQAFINHIQSGGEEQKANMIRNHFRNWVNTLNGSFQKIISDDGQQSNNSGNTAPKGTSTDRVQALRNW